MNEFLTVLSWANAGFAVLLLGVLGAFIGAYVASIVMHYLHKWRLT